MARIPMAPIPIQKGHSDGTHSDSKGPFRWHPFRWHAPAPKPADKPGSVPRQRRGGDHLSGAAVARRLSRPTRGFDGTGRPAPAEAGLAPAWPCSRWGLPGRPCHHGRRWSLTPPFHHHQWPTASPQWLAAVPWLSAFLWSSSVGSPRLGVTQHRALWSPDFPRPVAGARPPGRLGRQLYDST